MAKKWPEALATDRTMTNEAVSPSLTPRTFCACIIVSAKTTLFVCRQIRLIRFVVQRLQPATTDVPDGSREAWKILGSRRNENQEVHTWVQECIETQAKICVTRCVYGELVQSVTDGDYSIALSAYYMCGYENHTSICLSHDSI